MAYNATYTSADTDDVIIDLLVTVLVAMVAFGTLIGLGILWNVVRGKKWNGKMK